MYAELPKPPDLTKGDVVPVAILDRRLKKKGNDPVVQLLIQWSNHAVAAATWEDADVLKLRFPNAVIWEGALSQGEAIVTPAPEPD